MNKFKYVKAIIFIMLFVNSRGSWSQGNLQFSQVINLTPGTTYTVPANKVLKIESFTSQSLPIYTTTLQSQSCSTINGPCACTWSAQSYLNIGSFLQVLCCLQLKEYLRLGLEEYYYFGGYALASFTLH